MLDTPYVKKCGVCGILFFRATPEEAIDDLKQHLVNKHSAIQPVRDFEERLTGEDMAFLRDMGISHT